MLDNYYKGEYGVIHQKEVKEFNKDYAAQYNNYGELSNYMSYLRLGWLGGAIGYLPESILDIGYGNGAFLNVCKQAGINICHGEDISNYPLPEGCTSISYDDIFKTHYDVITMFDSFEHFEDLSFIGKLDCSYLIISVPNCYAGEEDEWFGSWKHRREDEHLHHFNITSLNNFCGWHNYRLINYSYIEDAIRKDDNYKPNILTACFDRCI